VLDIEQISPGNRSCLFYDTVLGNQGWHHSKWKGQDATQQQKLAQHKTKCYNIKFNKEAKI